MVGFIEGPAQRFGKRKRLPNLRFRKTQRVKTTKMDSEAPKNRVQYPPVLVDVLDFENGCRIFRKLMGGTNDGGLVRCSFVGTCPEMAISSLLKYSRNWKKILLFNILMKSVCFRVVCGNHAFGR